MCHHNVERIPNAKIPKTQKYGAKSKVPNPMITERLVENQNGTQQTQTIIIPVVVQDATLAVQFSPQLQAPTHPPTTLTHTHTTDMDCSTTSCPGRKQLWCDRRGDSLINTCKWPKFGDEKRNPKRWTEGPCCECDNSCDGQVSSFLLLPFPPHHPTKPTNVMYCTV